MTLDRLGLCPRLSGLGRGTRDHLSQREGKAFRRPLARELEFRIFLPLDLAVPGQMEAVSERFGETWGELDFLVHSIAFSPKDTLRGRVTDAPREGFLTTMEISCWSFIRMAATCGAADEERRHTFHHDLLRVAGGGGKLQYHGQLPRRRSKAHVRYMAAELGPKGIRVHAISPGALATRAASGIPEFDALLERTKLQAPGPELVDIDDVGMADRVSCSRRRAVDNRSGPLR